MEQKDVDEMQKCMGYDLDGFLFWAAPRRKISVGHRAGKIGSGGYIRFCFNGRSVTAHRAIFAWHHGYWPKLQIDHINRIRSDNRIENLREVTAAQNSQNNIAKGYYYNKETSKWLAKIMAEGKLHYLGLFETEQGARRAYLAAKKVFHI